MTNVTGDWGVVTIVILAIHKNGDQIVSTKFYVTNIVNR
jgi:hypothetical protein